MRSDHIGLIASMAHKIVVTIQVSLHLVNRTSSRSDPQLLSILQGHSCVGSSEFPKTRWKPLGSIQITFFVLNSYELCFHALFDLHTWAGE